MINTEIKYNIKFGNFDKF